CVPPIIGDRQFYYNTSYQTQFEGGWTSPAKPIKKLTSVKFGDLRSSGYMSEQKHAYVAPNRRTHSVYDKERAASHIYRTNVQLGDGCTRFSTLTSEHFPVHNIEPITLAPPTQYASSIPRGDEDPERNQVLARTTTMQLSYPETGRWNFPPKPDPLLQKSQSNICLRDECSGVPFFSTTHQAHYEPPPWSQRVMADSKRHHESHIPFDYHNTRYVTTTQAMLVPHEQQKQRPSEDMLRKIKYSHLGVPWRVQARFSTEQKDEFTPKTTGPAEIRKANSQVSYVPLGTLKKHHPHKK
ncbi:PREDICTED: uncharacterized protein C19orf45-like, partial [Eurypyga helias]|uniref:uncharacterized protein C19orf45-like n=1 Tax=Eurypyga helias TaxID=54383 RepID=UPI0005282AFD